MKIVIDSKIYGDCTIGRLYVIQDDGKIQFQCYTLELPDFDNRKNISCIPAGTYQAFKRFSPSKQSEVIQLKDVPNRTYIQIHIGNYTRQIQGCILPGMYIKHIDKDGVPDVGGSEKAFETIMEIMPDEFEIEIIRA